MGYPTGIVRGVDGKPVPPSDIVARLRRIHPSLSLRYHAMTWQLTWEWPESDYRWEWVQKQHYPRESAFDVIGRIPMDCPLDQVPSYCEREFRNATRPEIRGLMDRVQQYNEQDVAQEQVEAVVAATLDSLGSSVSGGVSVSVAADIGSGKKRGRKAKE